MSPRNITTLSEANCFRLLLKKQLIFAHRKSRKGTKEEIMQSTLSSVKDQTCLAKFMKRGALVLFAGWLITGVSQVRRVHWNHHLSL